MNMKRTFRAVALDLMAGGIVRKEIPFTPGISRSFEMDTNSTAQSFVSKLSMVR